MMNQSKKKQVRNSILREIIKELEAEKKKRCDFPYWGNWMNWRNWGNWMNWRNWYNWWN